MIGLAQDEAVDRGQGDLVVHGVGAVDGAAREVPLVLDLAGPGARVREAHGVPRGAVDLVPQVQVPRGAEVVQLVRDVAGLARDGGVVEVGEQHGRGRVQADEEPAFEVRVRTQLHRAVRRHGVVRGDGEDQPVVALG